MKKDTDQNEINNETPFWHKLLIEWEKEKNTVQQNKGQGASGLTLPFILGVQNSFLGVKDPIGIEQLFKDIEKYLTHINTDVQYRVRDCPKLNENVLCYVLAQNKADYKIAFEDKSGYIQFSPEHISDLIKKYSGYIQQGKFSRNNGKWGDYSDEEKVFINKALNLSPK